MSRSLKCTLFIWLLFYTVGIDAEVHLPNVLSSHAVFQRNQPIVIWGWGNPGEHVEVAFHNQTEHTVTDPSGRWQLTLDPEAAGGPYEMRVQGRNAIVLKDILVGDVFIASGQSNMGYPLRGIGPAVIPGASPSIIPNAKQVIAAAHNTQLRLLHTPRSTADYPQEDQAAQWERCTPQSVPDFSVLGYMFGLGLQEHEHIPIGIIESAFGGSPLATWVSMDTLSRSPELLPNFAYWSYFADQEGNVPLMGRQLTREKEKENDASKNGHPVMRLRYPNLIMWRPASLFNAMIAPFTKFAVKGVVWYQGESSTAPTLAGVYARTFSALIGDWREHWDEGNFPFIFIQISSFRGRKVVSWGTVRDAQRRTLAVANTAMVVSLDVGNPDLVHPTNKRAVADRMLMAARQLVYGENIEASGPLYREARPQGKSIRVWFDHAKGLYAKGGTLQGFQVASADRVFVPASAVIKNDNVLVSSPQVCSPLYVRYAWENNSMDANLFNGVNLPASTFTSEPPTPVPVAP